MKTIHRNLATSLLLVGIAWLGACGEEDSDSTDDATTSLNPEATAAAAQLTAAAPATFISTSQGALQSAQVGTINVTTGSLIQDSATSQSTNDSLCSEYGEPWDSTTNAVKNDGDDYTSHLFYCKVNSNVIESSDTIPGTLTQIKSILCSMEENYSITVDDYTTAGTEHITSDNGTMTLSNTCWPQGQPDGGSITSVPMDSVITTSLAEDSGWQYSLYFKSDAISLEYTLKFFTDNGVFGFTTYQPNEGGLGQMMTMTIDTGAGVLLFSDLNDQANGDDNTFRGHSRIRVKGTMSSDLDFSEITEGRGFVYISGPDYDGTADQDHTYSVYTIDGNSTTGWQSKQLWTNETPGTLEERSSVCSDGDETCSDSSDVGTISCG
ncbi:hypothetical protein [Pseudobacteriovorax antillogorgiicola]|uniref:Lipoprotein n=1 Tax=Pseudobacteriovorax antillogorgiicola TaxID=1513793 RepID=A0A1Y6B6K3_9BACT|nr:hypothetical protein [Pseudobacteriovorax antillogorgiicola]TCS58789.1 hypothetical protein EDD56_102304 [Pseudobacteriovorax antillogorgiicola]SME94710.1 hypothetical protein SAMN06296036_102139 [Pseudobacteriovorax antillogorgiicola]